MQPYASRNRRRPQRNRHWVGQRGWDHSPGNHGDGQFIRAS